MISLQPYKARTNTPSANRILKGAQRRGRPSRLERRRLGLRGAPWAGAGIGHPDLAATDGRGICIKWQEHRVLLCAIVSQHKRGPTMTNRSVKGLLVAVVALLALNLVAHWGMSQPPPPPTPSSPVEGGGVVGMATGELSSNFMVVYRLHQDGTIEGTRLSKDVWNKLKEGTWTALARPLPAEPPSRQTRDRPPAQP